MTDTPRSLDELLDLFASNPNGDISAQGLRDFVVSVAAGLGNQFGDAYGGYFSCTFDTPIAVANGSSHFPEPFADQASHFIADPLGYLQTEDYESDYFGRTLAAGTYFALPVGTYLVTAQESFSSDTGGHRVLLGYDVEYDNRWNTVGWAPISADPLQAGSPPLGPIGILPNGGETNFSGSFLIVITQEMVDAAPGGPVVIGDGGFFSTAATGGSVNWTSHFCRISRIG